MRTTTKQALSGFLALALSVIVLPGAADAQEQEAQQQQECTAQVSPQAVEAGQKAVSVTARLSTGVGAIEGVEGGESGIALADPADIQRSEMAREGEQPQPIQMSRENQGQVTLWLSTQDAEAGTHEVTLTGADGKCTAQIQVAEAAQPQEEGVR